MNSHWISNAFGSHKHNQPTARIKDQKLLNEYIAELFAVMYGQERVEFPGRNGYFLLIMPIVTHYNADPLDTSPTDGN